MWSDTKFMLRRVAVRSGCEAGNIAVLAAVVIALVVLLALSVSRIGVAAINRSRSTTAADAVALAAATDDSAGIWIQEKYRDVGIETSVSVVSTDSGEAVRVDAHAGQSRAHAIAVVETLDPSPMMAAVVARANQLLDTELDAISIDANVLKLAGSDADIFAQIAWEFDMCETTQGTARVRTFELCSKP